MIMNPLCLLTKGRTFKDMADRPGAYKLLANRALPKFTAGRRAPSGPLHSAPQTAQTSLFEQPPAAVKATVVEARKSAAPPVETVKPSQPVVSKSPFAQDAKTSKMACARGVWRRSVRFCKRLIQRFVFGRKGRPVHETTVQTELALEKVTVMRNDLNEDDLEVVLVERTVGTGEKPLARLSKMEMTGEAWNRLTAPFRKKSSENAFSPKAETKPSPELSAPV
jgi:hypothetical protein